VCTTRRASTNATRGDACVRVASLPRKDKDRLEEENALSGLHQTLNIWGGSTVYLVLPMESGSTPVPLGPDSVT
jgi:hypothetical protein